MLCPNCNQEINTKKYDREVECLILIKVKHFLNEHTNIHTLELFKKEFGSMFEECFIKEVLR